MAESVDFSCCYNVAIMLKSFYNVYLNNAKGAGILHPLRYFSI
mgnify:CR=1 FL=1